MSRMPEIIVMLWFVPVVLHIILPLMILLGYSVLKLFLPEKGEERVLNRSEIQNRAKPQPAL